MLTNYHTHSSLCDHADGQPYEYAAVAINNGLSILGFSDHTPYPFPDGYKSGFRIQLENTEKYVTAVNNTKEKFRDKIDIYLGYEAEYYPKFFDKMLKHIEGYGYDYLILGQHFINNEYDGVWSGAPTDENGLKIYISQLIEAIKTGMFSYIAHPDLINYREDETVFRKETERLLDACLIYDIPLEFNLLGFRENRHYPYSVFWEEVGKSDCKTVIGWDAHSPQFAGDNEIYKKALTELKKYGITPIEKIKLKKG